MNFYIKKLLLLFSVIAGGFLSTSGLALADDICWTTSMRLQDVVFPTKTSYFLATGGIAYTSLQDSGFRCRAKGKVSFSEDEIAATINSDTPTDGNKSYLVNDAYPDNRVMFQVYYDEKQNHPVNYGQREVVFTGDWFQIIQPGQSKLVPLYFRIFPERNIRYQSGLYQTTIRINWDWKVCKRSVLVCVSWEDGKATTFTDIKMQVIGDCVIRSDQDTLNFGTRPFVQDFDPVTNTITVNCTSDIKDYSVGVSMGNNSDGDVRNMKSASGDNIAYQIYKGNSKEVWAGYREPKDSANRRSKDEADYHNQNGQVFRYSAQILPGQSPKPQGNYEDEVIIDFVF